MIACDKCQKPLLSGDWEKVLCSEEHEEYHLCPPCFDVYDDMVMRWIDSSIICPGCNYTFEKTAIKKYPLCQSCWGRLA